MIRALARRSFTLALCAAGFLLPACAKEPAAPTPIPGDNWVVGTNYNVLARPQPADAPAGKVAVVEFFWYGCPHCAAVDPMIQTWNAKKAGYIHFSRTHIVWGPVHAQHAKLYYTLLALDRLDLHPKVFEEIHQNHDLLAAQDEIQARSMQQTFLEKNGVSKKDFDAAYDSMSVQVNVQKARDDTQRFAIENVPTIVVNGTYVTNVAMAGSPAQLLRLIDYLAAREKHN
jgi:thiol:disulfide interchange protein DsbA